MDPFSNGRQKIAHGAALARAKSVIQEAEIEPKLPWTTEWIQFFTQKATHL